MLHKIKEGRFILHLLCHKHHIDLIIPGFFLRRVLLIMHLDTLRNGYFLPIFLRNILLENLVIEKDELFPMDSHKNIGHTFRNIFPGILCIQQTVVDVNLPFRIGLIFNIVFI